MLYRTSGNAKDSIRLYGTIIKALTILLHNIGEVLNVLPKHPSANGTKFIPPAPLDQRDWQFLFINSKTINYQQGNTIISQDDENTDLWYIQSGSADVLVKNKLITTLGDGEFFGDISFISQLPDECKIIAKRDSIIQRMSGEFVLRVLECDCNLFERFYFMMGKFTAERLVRKTSSWTKVPFSPNVIARRGSEIMSIEIF